MDGTATAAGVEEQLSAAGVLVLHSLVYGGLLLDLVLLPVGLNVGSCWPSVRALAATAAISFHLCNHWLFVIETFPFVMVAATALFFDHDWIDLCFEMLRAMFTGNDPVITQESARIAHAEDFYSNDKVRQALSFDFKPAGEMLDEVCNDFMAKVHNGTMR